MAQRPRFTQITVAVGSGPEGELAARRAALLPLGAEASISLVHPVPETIPAPARAAVLERIERTLEGARAELEEQLRARGHLDASVDSATVTGRAFVGIIRHARARGAELVVMGREPGARRRGAGELTAERVIRKSDVPALLVQRSAEEPYRRALLAIDLSDASRRVVELAIALVPPEVDVLRAVHAFHVPFADWFGAETLDAYRRECRDGAGAALQRVEAMFEPLGVHCRAVVREGEPRTALLREVVKTGADLVVLGTHARSGVAHALLGSVAEWMVGVAPCDVAVTRPARYTFELP
jgi:nucleotide-binding universal stress UspA family protein